MTSNVSNVFSRLWLCLGLLVVSFQGGAACEMAGEDGFAITAKVPVEAGQQRFSFVCDIDSPHILYFSDNSISFNQLYDQDMRKISALPGAFQAYPLDPSNKLFYLDLSSQVERFLTLNVSTLADYQRFSSVHTLTMSLFIGFCLALVLYVGMLGSSMRNYGFYSYSFYVFSAAIFFSLQEGLLNIVFPDISLFSNFKLILLFAGLTVFAAVRFLDQLLDFKVLLMGWQRHFLLGMANTALALSLLQLVLPYSGAALVNHMLSLITLITMTGTLSSCVYATYRKVHCSALVMTGIAVIVLTMLFRLVFVDTSEFMYRYGLVVGITLEAFIFAMATCRKVKKLDDDRVGAFKRASTDALCNVLNRSGWESMANTILSTYNKERGYLTLLFIDVDHFKEINDQYGHHAGDKVLQVIAKILKSRCREQDAVGRLGGDEFVVLSHCYSEGQSERLAARVEASLSGRDIRTDNYVIPVTASVGAYITQERCKDLTSLLDRADKIMYHVKAQKKDEAPAVS